MSGMFNSIWGSIPKSDQSISILQEVFGVNLNTILSNNITSEPTLFGYLFQYFNAGLLGTIMIIYAYVIIVGTINSAQDGKFLGKNWNSVWVMLRSLGGVISAVPFQTGYCLAQYIIYAMISTGVSFADYLWASVVEKVVDGNVPPVVSSEVINNIETYLATFMMSNLTRHIIDDSGIYVKTDKNNLNNAPCIQSSATTTKYIYIPKPYILDSNGNRKYVTIPYYGDGSIAGLDYVQKSIAFKPISCNISFTTDANNGFVSTYYMPLINSVSSTDPSVKPLEIYSSYLQQGLATWSFLGPSYYVQTQLNTVDWQGHFTINQMLNQPKDAEIENIFHRYSVTVPAYLTANLVTQPNSLDTAEPTALDNTANAIIVALQKETGNVVPGCDDSDTNSLCYQAKTFGWWNADQLYLNFDNALATNLTNLYANFSKLSDAANKVSNKTSIPIEYDKIAVNYTQKTTYVGDMLAYGTTESFDPTISNGNQLTTIADLKPYKNLSKSATFVTSMDSVRQLFNQIIKDSSISDDSQARYTSEVNSLLVDGMSFEYAQYLYIISSLVSSAYSPYISADDSSQKTQLADDILNKTIIPVINLFSFFSTNMVNFGPTRPSSVNTNSVTDPAQQMLTAIFDKIGTNGNAGEVGGLLGAIYNIGSTCDSDDDQCNYAAQNYSMVQNVQAIGMSLIEGTINSMIGVYSHAVDELNQIQQSAKSQADSAKSNATKYTIINAATLGVASSTLNAQIALEYSQIMFNVTMQMARFSLSLMWLPLILFVLTSIFSIGVSFALIIPYTPFILFWAGKTAWLLLVIEAFVAAPIVAHGLAFPEGHDVFGKAQPGIKIAINLTLRPVLMVVGMICGIGLTYIVIGYSAEGFHAITDSLLNMLPVSDGSDAANIARGTFSVLIIFLYATFLAMAFSKCFSLIYIIPDKVLRWLGADSGDSGGEAAIQEFKGAGMQYAQGMAQAGGQTMSQGIESQKQLTQSYNQGTIDTSKSESQRNFAASNDAAKAGQQAAKMIMA
ncbi:DotA/TraY family protein [Thiotrichales bacterium 19X7-9]|nr:DotA/TraY family protein [Thiotrichales bacterium 19X7-9]